VTVPIFDMVVGGKSVIGSIVGTRNDLADVFALHAAGRTRVITVERKLGEDPAGSGSFAGMRGTGPGGYSACGPRPAPH
jgi:hypothetical protein